MTLLTTSRAESNEEKKPEWKPPTVVYSLSTIGRYIEHEGDKLRCYTADEGRMVLIPMFADYRALFKAAWLWEAERTELLHQIDLLERMLSITTSEVAFYKDKSDNWQAIAKAKANKLELSQRWTWVPWSLVVIESLAVGIIGVKNMATN